MSSTALAPCHDSYGVRGQVKGGGLADAVPGHLFGFIHRAADSKAKGEGQDSECEECNHVRVSLFAIHYRTGLGIIPPLSIFFFEKMSRPHKAR